MKTCVCAIAKCESNYIREWVDHYRKIGFDHVVIYDNNDDPEESRRMRDSVEDVEFVDWMDKVKPCQVPAYQDCYDRLKDEYDWFAFFDIDEFLMVDGGNIGDMLSRDIFSGANLIRISWKHFGDNGKITVENGDYSVVGRFTEPFGHPFNQDWWTKAMLKGGLSAVFDTGDDGPHLTNMRGFDVKAVNALGKPVNNMTIKNGRVHENMWLNHYVTKTIEEYAGKVARGYATNVDKGAEPSFRKFFGNHGSATNEWTKEKHDWILEHAGIDVPDITRAGADIEYSLLKQYVARLVKMLNLYDRRETNGVVADDIADAVRVYTFIMAQIAANI